MDTNSLYHRKNNLGRDDMIYRLHRQGNSDIFIANNFGLSKLRIQQIIKRRKHRDFKVPLSSEEMAFLRFIARGYSTKEIASMFCVKPFVINDHRRNIIDKLNSFNMRHAIYKGFQSNLIRTSQFKRLVLPYNNGFTLSPREKEILPYLANGLKTDGIAKLFNLSGLTIKRHMQNMLEKSGAKNSCHLITVSLIEKQLDL